jgi:hypothetical protein
MKPILSQQIKKAGRELIALGCVLGAFAGLAQLL